jgi:hypothetical protein
MRVQPPHFVSWLAAFRKFFGDLARTTDRILSASPLLAEDERARRIPT